MSNRWCEEQNRCQRESERHQDADKSYLGEGVAVLDLVRNARRLFAMQEPREERRLLNFFLSNCACEDGEVVATFRQPLDMLAETETATTRLEAGENARSAKGEIWLPDLYDYLEAESYTYTIRLKANAVLQGHIAHLLKRPVGCPPMHVQRFLASFSYQAGSWSRKRRVVAKVEWHPGELTPRVGFIVTNLARPANRIVTFYDQRGTAEQWIKEGKSALK